MIVITIVAGILGYVVVPAIRQQSAVKRILNAGGHVGYQSGCNSRGEHLFGETPNLPTWLAERLAPCNWAYFGEVTHVFMSGVPISDKDLRVLGWLHGLRTVYLDDSHVGDNGIESLYELRSLSRLNLAGTRVTDDGLRPFARMKSLTELVVPVGISDDTVAYLAANLPNCMVEVE
ncbi:MAG: hypothetical protein CMJ58_27795 [Planctomycetaceae bacterium]|nr:hypothetical protein [Planctomycetaceae bacterium]